MSYAEAVLGSTRQYQTRLATILGIACLLSLAAFAQAREEENEIPRAASRHASSTSDVTAPSFDPAILVTLDSIDAQTDITVFLHGGVPADLRHAALRRAWIADPAIRDFRGMQENDWDFNDLTSIVGFGELGPDVDMKTMVAQILGERPVLASRSPRQPESYAALRLLQTLFMPQRSLSDVVGHP